MISRCLDFSESVMIRLPAGGSFDVRDLVIYITTSGRDYIIQGQQNTSFVNHTKRRSLDYWLRERTPNRDTRQAENSVLDALVATGRFEIVDNLICPDSGEECKGVRLTPQFQRADEPRMLEIHVTTTDGEFESDLNAANIQGISAECRPIMAFDSAGHIFQVVVTVASTMAGRVLGKWLADRIARDPGQSQITINNHVTINAQNVTQVIQQIVDEPDRKK